MVTNKYGLSRYIPADVKRQVRQDCGFGCIICGMALVEYEHVDPLFSEAVEHDPQNIVLLCAGCHAHVTRGMWSKEKIVRARKAPKTFKEGFAHDAFDFIAPFEVHVGHNIIRNVHCIVSDMQGEEWFTIDPPEEDGAPPRLSAKFFSPDGTLALEIVENEWKCYTGVWDLSVKGRNVKVFSDASNVVLELCASPPHGLKIVQLKMSLGESKLQVNKDGDVLLSRGKINVQLRSNDINYSDSVFKFI